jgi:hypothetical protein
MNKKLSILKPLIINNKNIDFNYQIYKDSPYYPYQAILKDNSKFFFGFSLKKVNSNYKIIIILQILSNKKYEYNKNIFKEYNIGKNYIYSTISLNKEKLIITLKNLKYINKNINHINENNENNKNNENNENKIINIKELYNLIKNNKTLFETGAGISYKVIPSFNKIKNFINKYYDTKKILLYPDKIINKLEKWFMKVINSNPTIGHKSLKKICNITNSGLITGNFDNLHLKSGIIPINIQKNKNYRIDLKKNIKKIKLLVVIGVNADFVDHNFYRKNGVKIVVFVLNKDTIPSFITSSDYIIFGDLHENLYNLYKLFSK